MYARISTIHNNGTAEERDHRVAVARELFPRVTAQVGCLGGLILNNPSGGDLRVVVLWETAEAMIKARDDGKAFREQFAASIGIAVAEIDVQLYDVDTWDLSRLPTVPGADLAEQSR